MSTQEKILLSFLNPLLISVACYGQIDMLNVAAPILPRLNADPHRTVFGKKFYLYPTTDVFSGWKASSFSYWSSKDLINWKNEKVILDFPKDLNWEEEKAWAPAIASKNNKYYFYFIAEGKY